MTSYETSANADAVLLMYQLMAEGLGKVADARGNDPSKGAMIAAAVAMLIRNLGKLDPMIPLVVAEMIR